MKNSIGSKFLKSLGLCTLLLVSSCAGDDEVKVENEEWGSYINGVVAKVYVENFRNSSYSPDTQDKCVVAGNSFKSNLKFSIEPYQGDISGCQGSKYRVNSYELRFKNEENNEINKVNSLKEDILIECKSGSIEFKSFEKEIASSSLNIDTETDKIYKFKVQLYASIEHVPDKNGSAGIVDSSHSYKGKTLVIGSTKQACDDYIRNNP